MQLGWQAGADIDQGSIQKQEPCFTINQLQCQLPKTMQHLRCLQLNNSQLPAPAKIALLLDQVDGYGCPTAPAQEHIRADAKWLTE
jgi:hypothetical protein